jgi:hypothetical protein
MGLREIKAALSLIQREGNEKDVRHLIVAVPYKRGEAPERAEIIGYIAKERDESPAEMRKLLAGWRPGVLIRAESHNSRPAEADLAMLGDSSFEHTGEVVYPRPNELRWDEAQFIDGNGEFWPLDRWRDVATAILFGSRGGHNPWFDNGKRTRY